MAQAKKIGWDLLDEAVRLKIETGSPDGGIDPMDIVYLDEFNNHVDDMHAHGRVIHLEAGIDLNDILDDGIYFINAGSPVLNAPFTGSFYLTTRRHRAGSVDFCEQSCVTPGTGYSLFRRNITLVSGVYSSTTQWYCHFSSYPMNFFVDSATGVDDVGYGFEHTKPFKTLQYALAAVPKHSSSPTTIQVFPGTYGGGSITNYGGGELRIHAVDTSNPPTIENLRITGVSTFYAQYLNFTKGIIINDVASATLYYCKKTASYNVSDGGIQANRSTVDISYCQVSNNTSTYGIQCLSSLVSLTSVTGTGNSGGIYVSGGVVFKDSASTITGTVAEKKNTGGQIFSS